MIPTALLDSVAATISDYRTGEIPTPDAAHVRRWIEQFDPEVRVPLLEEMDHVLSETYVSKPRMLDFLGRLATNDKLTAGDPKAFWLNAHVLHLQDGTKSQAQMLEILTDAVAERVGVDLGSGDPTGPFVYLDDGLFSGTTLRGELLKWVENSAPQEAALHIVVIAYHTSGGHYSVGKVEARAKELGKKLKVTVWRLHAFEDRLARINDADVFRPTRTTGDPLVEAYAARLVEWGHPATLRKPRSKEEDPFRSVAGRDLLEWEFLRAGCRILSACQDPKRVLRPLGFHNLNTLGFGAIFATYRNCPNNCPLALWWGQGDGEGPLGWYPLLPRRPPEDTAAFFARLGSGAKTRNVARRSSLMPATEEGERDPPWEADAHAALQTALEALTFELEDGTVRSPEEQGESVFESLDELLAHLMEVYDEAWCANVPFENGEAVFESDSQDSAMEKLEEMYRDELTSLGWI